MARRTKHTDAGSRRWTVASRLRALLSLWRPALNLTLAAGLLADVAGCSRWYYRKRADEEVAEVLGQKDKYPDWAIENWHVYPDPRARFGDPSPDPDHPPKPPDDPAAFDLSPNPQKPGKAGVVRTEGTGYLELIAQWDRENRERRAREETEEQRRQAEPPVPGEEQEARRTEEAGLRAAAKQGPGPGQETASRKAPPDGPAVDAAEAKAAPREDAIALAKSRSAVDITDRPTYLLTLEQAAELAMFNSREYQDQREALYLAALPVTQERFSFMAQFFAAEQAIRGYSGREAPGGQSSTWALNSGTGFSKLLPTGALLLLSFSNQTVFNFLNPKKTLSVSDLNFTAIQPLLRGGGQAVALEPLTLVERNLLYQIRRYARFRKELYVSIASNSGGGISGGSFQPTGVLSNTGSGGTGLGSSGIIPGVIPSVPTTINGPLDAPNSPGSLFLAAAIAPPASGYLNTMLQKIQVYIDQENIDVLTGILQRYRGLLEGDVVQPLQVQNVEQQLLAGRTSLLGNQAQYLQSINAFKIALGVPVQLNIETDDAVLQPLLKQFRRSRAIIDNEHAAVKEAAALIPLEKAPRVRAELRRLFQKSALVQGTRFARRIGERWAAWEKLNNKELDARLDELQKAAQKLLDLQAELQVKDQTLSPADEAKLREVKAERDLGNLERVLRAYEAAYLEGGKPKKPADAAGERQRIRLFQTVLSAWQNVLVEPRDEQLEGVRASWPDLPRCCVDGVDLIKDDLGRAQATAARYALTHRLDLMNVRAQVVDAWRQVAVFANALLGTFNVEYRLNAFSPAGMAQPLNIGGSGTTHQLVLNGQLPLVRVNERNNYRASLIGFQRQRRALQQAEDLTVLAVQGELFQLRQLAEAYRVQQRQLELAYLTIDSAQESLLAPPPPPPPPGVRGTGGADGPAALTQQLLSAQRSLPTAQTGLLTVWINYLNARLQLFRDLELMPLDARGVWLDEIRDCDCGLTGGPVPAPAPGPELLPPPSPEMKK